MSFLSILLVASAFYFAHARPDSQSWDIPPEVKQVPAAPEDPSEPIMDPSNFQHQLFGLMEDMSKAVEQYMTPLMSKLEEKKQHQLKAMCMDGFASYINYVLLLTQESAKDKGEGDTHGSSQPRHEMIIQYETPYEMDPDTPFMADAKHEEEEEEDEE